MATLTEKLHSSIYFLFQSKFDKEISGTPMGSPLSLIVADTLTKTLEVALQSTSMLTIFLSFAPRYRYPQLLLEPLHNQSNIIKLILITFSRFLMYWCFVHLIGHSVYRKSTNKQILM